MGDSIAYIDESGGLDKPSFVLGGYLASTDTWGAFTRDWQAVLDREPAWPALHMAQCHRARDEPWRTFARNDRIARIEDLIKVIAQHDVHAFLTTIRTEALRASEAANAEIRDISEGYPYLMAAGALIPALTGLHEAKGVDFGVIDLVFDSHQQFQGKVREEVTTMIEPFLRFEVPKRRARLGTVDWIGGAEKRNHVPLQAADMLVWHWRRGRDESFGRSRHWGSLRMASKPLLLKYPGESDLRDLFTAHV